MYVKKDRRNQRQIKFLCLEDMVPQEHLLRYIDRAIDFSFIYEETQGLYGEEDWGKPGIAKDRESRGKKPLKKEDDNNRVKRIRKS